VLTGALQDHGRAAVVGARTFGKGMVNTVFSWRNFDFRLKLTTGHYYTPGGRNLEKAPGGDGGIAPDVAVALEPELWKLVGQALLEHEVPERHLAALRAFSTAHGARLPGILTPAEDPQLAAALQALRARVAGATGNGK
jgi:carboxyl-terminal processing protease